MTCKNLFRLHALYTRLWAFYFATLLMASFNWSISDLDADQMALTYAGDGFLVDLVGRPGNGDAGGGPPDGIQSGSTFEGDSRLFWFEVA